jgi:hypothetical protein
MSVVYRKVGKRKAAAKPEKVPKTKKEKKAKKDPNKPKRPPSAFFVFLLVSLSVTFCCYSSFLKFSDLSSILL